MAAQPVDRRPSAAVAESLQLRSDRIQSRLATGYVLGSSGHQQIEDREWIGGGDGGVYSSSRDLARYLAALLGGGTNQHGSILEPGTLLMMFDNQFQTDPRLPGVGLAFFIEDREVPQATPNTASDRSRAALSGV